MCAKQPRTSSIPFHCLFKKKKRRELTLSLCERRNLPCSTDQPDLVTTVEAFFAEVDRMRPGDPLPTWPSDTPRYRRAQHGRLANCRGGIQAYPFPIEIRDREFRFHPVRLGETQKLADIRFIRSDCKKALEKFREPKKAGKQPQGEALGFK